jgi:2-polyprenyl-6-methoxyphenol hydroxylase-like FAD-dependent oxidoreductase
VIRTAIVGAGIAGLGAAIALRRAGLDAVVWEREPELREVGAGLTLWPNAVHALRRLGISDAVLRAGARLTSGSVRSWRGAALVSTGLDLEQLFAAPAVGIHRADLQRILLEAAGAEMTRQGARCIGFAEAGSGVEVRFADGRSVTADVLVGADGINSAVRQAVLGVEEPRRLAWAAWRAVCTGVPPPSDTNITIGPGAHFGYLPIGSGRTYWFAVTELGLEAEALARRFQDWPDPVVALIRSTPSAAVLRNDLIDRPPAQRWGRGRVTLIGDAAHAMLPGLGQGACQALEDAVALADCLRNASDPESGLRRYEALRMARTARITNLSRSALTMLQWQHPAARALRTLLLRVPVRTALARQAWIYGYGRD